jgi:hypothetical protein
LCCRAPLAVETAKVIAQDLMTSVSEPSALAAATEAPSGLVACEYAEVRTSAHRVLQFFNKIKTVADDGDGER